jgi:hypothetical protein
MALGGLLRLEGRENRRNCCENPGSAFFPGHAPGLR